MWRLIINFTLKNIMYFVTVLSVFVVCKQCLRDYYFRFFSQLTRIIFIITVVDYVNHSIVWRAICLLIILWSVHINYYGIFIDCRLSVIELPDLIIEDCVLHLYYTLYRRRYREYLDHHVCRNQFGRCCVSENLLGAEYCSVEYFSSWVNDYTSFYSKCQIDQSCGSSRYNFCS